MALNCKLNRSILKSDNCAYQLLEINEIYLANFGDLAINASADTAGCESVTAITTASTAITGDCIAKIQPAKNSVSFTDELVVDENSGAKYRTHTLTFSIPNRYDGCLHTDFDKLSLGKFVAFIKTADGNTLVLGKQVGLEASAATLAGGGDSNGMTITLAANVAESVMPLSDDAVSDMEALVIK